MNRLGFMLGVILVADQAHADAGRWWPAVAVCGNVHLRKLGAGLGVARRFST